MVRIRYVGGALVDANSLDKWLLTILLLVAWIGSAVADYMGIKLTLDMKTIGDMLLAGFLAEVKNNMQARMQNGNGENKTVKENN